jgi:hypothetical protein
MTNIYTLFKRNRKKLSNNNWPNFRPKTEATEKSDWLCIEKIVFIYLFFSSNSIVLHKKDEIRIFTK